MLTTGCRREVVTVGGRLAAARRWRRVRSGRSDGDLQPTAAAVLYRATAGMTSRCHSYNAARPVHLSV